MSKYNYPNWHEFKDLVAIYSEYEWDDARVKVWNPREQKGYNISFCGSSRPFDDNVGEINFVLTPEKPTWDSPEPEEQERVFFISGHRDITEEEFEKYKMQITLTLVKYPNARFVVGDYYGVDIMAQDYLVLIGCADRTTVYHMFDSPRNYNKEIKNFKGGFQTDEERDACMTKDSDEDIAFVRKGKRNSGTAQNLIRRIEF